MTTRQIIPDGADPVDFDLRNNDLTDLGFSFVQRYHDRWVSRLYKDRGEQAEARFLAKWFEELTGRPN